MDARKIIHIDMDAFYASVELRDNPRLRGYPIAVGHDSERGVIATASYEARTYGVHSALPAVVAKRLCPQLIFVEPRMEVYKAVSQQIRSIFHDYTDLVEPLSLDEAFLDVTHHPSATIVAQEIKQRIWEELHLTASAGVSVNKMLAKIASDYQKPNGLFVIPPDRIEDFIADLPVEKFFGVGEVTAERMHRLGIRTGRDLRQWSEIDLIRQFGKIGSLYYGYARGVDTREVNANRVRKTLGAERTFSTDMDAPSELKEALSEVTSEVWRRMKRHGFTGKTVVLKLKFDDFRQITRSKTLYQPVTDVGELNRVAEELLSEVALDGHKIRLMGLSVGNAQDAAGEWIQSTLDFDHDINAK